MKNVMMCALILSMPAGAMKEQGYVSVSFEKKEPNIVAKIFTPERLKKLGTLALYGAAFVPCIYSDVTISYVCDGLESAGVEAASVLAPIVAHTTNFLLAGIGTTGVLKTVFDIQSKAVNAATTLLGGLGYLWGSGALMLADSARITHTQNVEALVDKISPLSEQELSKIIKKAQKLEF